MSGGNNNKTHIKLSKYLSLVLRHKPEALGITLDTNGWTDVKVLLEKMNSTGKKIGIDTLKTIVETNNKKRFTFNEDFTLIRANQGHSIEVDLGFKPKTPPEILYHGTGDKNVESILKEGLHKRNRQHVHLSKDVETARNVGQRHGKPVIFEIQTEDMLRDGFEFYESKNGVWLTDAVPVKYIRMK